MSVDALKRKRKMIKTMNLRENIAENITKLRKNDFLVTHCQSHILGNDTMNKYYNLIAKTEQQLDGIDALFEIRKLHYDTLTDLYSKTENGKPDCLTNYLGNRYDSNLIKMIALQGYFSTTWAIYDTIALIVGHMSFIDTIAANPTSYPRLPEHIVLEKSKGVLGFRMHNFVYNLYAYPILLSYCLRNHFVHEACFNSNSIFNSDNIADVESFYISDQFYNLFAEKYKNLNKNCSRRDPKDWEQPNIIKIIELTEAENDEVNSILLTWTIDSIHSQLRLFASRVQNTP